MARFYEGRVAPDQRLRAGRWAAEGGWSPVYDSSMDGHFAAHDLALDRLETGSLTECTRGALLAAIRADAFADGRLPPEAELAEQLGVSRATLRAALQSLEADGLISRRRRHGTYVNGHLLRTSMRLNRLVPFTELIELCGHEPSVDVQRHRVEPARGEDAAALDVEPGVDCLVVERLLRAFLAELPSSMTVGRVRLEDGREPIGFLCEAAALDGAEEITSHGSWSGYLASRRDHGRLTRTPASPLA